jgi:antagonist of KipI
MAMLSIVRPGMLTTVQDLGRWGFQSRGVPISGAMDRYSHRLANRLLGNADNAATLEVTMMGPQVESEEATAFVVTGATFDLTLNGRAVAMNEPIEAPAGSILKFGERRRGARAYIAVAGGIDVPEVLGSRSTHVLTQMGGLDGRALRAGDRIATEKKGTGTFSSRPFLQQDSRPILLPAGGVRLRVIPGDAETFAYLAARRFRVSPQSNRMGYRLEGADREAGPAGDLISHAVPTGAVQVPPTGQPIMLMADHATAGGYCIGATVITADLSLAAQLAPGDWIEFEPCSLEEADRALLAQEAALGGA